MTKRNEKLMYFLFGAIFAMVIAINILIFLK